MVDTETEPVAQIFRTPEQSARISRAETYRDTIIGILNQIPEFQQQAVMRFWKQSHRLMFEKDEWCYLIIIGIAAHWVLSIERRKKQEKTTLYEDDCVIAHLENWGTFKDDGLVQYRSLNDQGQPEQNNEIAYTRLDELIEHLRSLLPKNISDHQNLEPALV